MGTPPARRRRCFTLTEMLAVIAIMLLLFGIAVAPLGKLLGGSGVNGAARMIGAELRLARQYAISQRKYVAVLMPSDTGPAELRYDNFRSCVTNASEEFVGWIPNTRWEQLPQGTVVSEVDDDYENDDTTNPQDNATTTVTDVDVDGSTYDMRAVVFAPTGRLRLSGGGLRRCVTVIEGRYSGGLSVRNAQNIACLKIDSYTGRSSYVDPLAAP